MWRHLRPASQCGDPLSTIRYNSFMNRADDTAGATLGTKVGLVPASDRKPAVRARAERDLVAL
jgi:hypothetical protein